VGCIMDEPENSKLYAEARRESFSVFTDFGDEGFEVEWDQLENLETLVGELRSYWNKHYGPKDESK
jgi:hypothetical protein